MKRGTKSLLFGVHQFVWHPLTVWRAWNHFYGTRPSFWQTVAIVLHDWGYWGCRAMDDAEGEKHPQAGATLIARLARWAGRGEWAESQYHHLVLYHSRYLAARDGVEPSALCWPDKLSVLFDPPWFYLLRARLSGEIKEYRKNAELEFPSWHSDREWYAWYRQRVRDICKRQEIPKSRYASIR